MLMLMLVQHFMKLSAAVHELLCWHADENNTAVATAGSKKLQTHCDENIKRNYSYQGRSDGGYIGIYTPPPKKISLP